MRADLGFGAANLQWVFNAYVVAFGGLLLLGGRLADLFGARRMFATGWTLCWWERSLAVAGSAGVELAVGRATQGAGSALIAPAALTLLMTLFGGTPKLPKAPRRVRRGRTGRWDRRCLPRWVITQWLSWPWVFWL